MTIVEIVYFSLVLWFAAWLTNVIARSFDIHLFFASGVTVVSFVFMISLFHQIKVRVVKDRNIDDAQD